MSGLSPERLDALTRMLREWHPIGSRWVAVGIAPLVADMLAAEREAGAAEVRARVEAWWTDHFGCRLDSCNCRDARDLRSYLNGGDLDV